MSGDGAAVTANFQAANKIDVSSQGGGVVVWDTENQPAQPVTLPAANGEVTWTFYITFDGEIFSFAVNSTGGVGRVIWEWSTKYTESGEYVPNSPALYTRFSPSSFLNLSASAEFDGWGVRFEEVAEYPNGTTVTVFDGVGDAQATMDFRFYFTARAGVGGGGVLATVPRPDCTVVSSNCDRISIDRATRVPGKALVNA
jgi:hypothetical protein